MCNFTKDSLVAGRNQLPMPKVFISYKIHKQLSIARLDIVDNA